MVELETDRHGDDGAPPAAASFPKCLQKPGLGQTASTETLFRSPPRAVGALELEPSPGSVIGSWIGNTEVST